MNILPIWLLSSMNFSMNEKDSCHYIVTYIDPESKKDPKNITLRVSDIRDSNLGLSFIRLAGFIFHDALSSIVDPVAEKLKERFKSTKSLHLSIYSIVSIEEVGVNHTGLTFEKDKSNILVLSDRQ